MDLIYEIEKILDMNSMGDFVIIGMVVSVFGYIVWHMATGSVPGIVGMMPPALAGAILGAMLYIFAAGTAGG